MRKINRLIVHCSATPEGRDVSMETIRQWHKAKGWSDIGYHYVIELDGAVRHGRPIDKIGAHVSGYNEGSIGIVYVGGVDKDMKAKDTRTDAQKCSLEELLLRLKSEYPEATVHGHNEFSSKACPSFDVRKEYGWIDKFH